MSLRKSPTLTPARLEVHPRLREHRSGSLPGKDPSRSCRRVRKSLLAAPRDPMTRTLTERSRDVIENKRTRDSGGAVGSVMFKIKAAPLAGKEMLKMKVPPGMCMKTKDGGQNVHRLLTENTGFSQFLNERCIKNRQPFRFLTTPSPYPCSAYRSYAARRRFKIRGIRSGPRRREGFHEIAPFL
jgi:hypothetical protein